MGNICSFPSSSSEVQGNRFYFSLCCFVLLCDGFGFISVVGGCAVVVVVVVVVVLCLPVSCYVISMFAFTFVRIHVSLLIYFLFCCCSHLFVLAIFCLVRFV